jgi:hypothetical protein
MKFLDPDPRDEEILQLRQRIAELEARSLESQPAQVDEAQQADAKRHASLVAAQQAVTSAGCDLDAVMHAVVQGAIAAAPRAEGAVIELREGDELVYRAASGRSAAHVGLRLQLHGALSGMCLLEGKPLICPDAETDDRVDRMACRPVGVSVCAR